jgi:membrane-associated phospholipid phosphatase
MDDLKRDFIFSLPRNILRCFWGRNLIWHILAISATVLFVGSDFDWMYFEATRFLAADLFPAVIVGLVVPVAFPVVSYILGSVRKNPRKVYSAYAVAQAGIIGLFISSLYKAFTGRPGPGHFIRPPHDISQEFRFGFLRGGVFYGWPSSHTTAAVAIAAALWKMYPENRWIRYGALVYSLYVGVGVSMTIHWFSDCVAGAIIGRVIGIAVGNFFNGCLLRGGTGAGRLSNPG